MTRTLTIQSRQMSAGERTNLGKLVTMKAKAATANLKAVIETLKADVERQLAQQFSARHELWADAVIEAKKAVDAADAKVAAACRKMGVPDNLRPGLQVCWANRGESFDKVRRAELRKAAYSQIAAQFRQGVAQIERWSMECRTELVEDSLTSEKAHAFFKKLPTTAQLMPRIAVPKLNLTIKSESQFDGDDFDNDWTVKRLVEQIEDTTPDPATGKRLRAS
jgi:hypothetical protein